MKHNSLIRLVAILAIVGIILVAILPAFAGY